MIFPKKAKFKELRDSNRKRFGMNYCDDCGKTHEGQCDPLILKIRVRELKSKLATVYWSLENLARELSASEIEHSDALEP